MRIDLQFDRRRPSHAGAVGLENRLAERKLDAMKHAPQSRAGGLAGTLGPQQRGNDVPCNGALGLREIDQQRKTLAQVQLDRADVTVDLREPERVKREGGHEIILQIILGPIGAPRGRGGDDPGVTAASDLANLPTYCYRDFFVAADLR